MFSIKPVNPSVEFRGHLAEVPFCLGSFISSCPSYEQHSNQIQHKMHEHSGGNIFGGLLLVIERNQRRPRSVSDRACARVAYISVISGINWVLSEAFKKNMEAPSKVDVGVPALGVVILAGAAAIFALMILLPLRLFWPRTKSRVLRGPTSRETIQHGEHGCCHRAARSSQANKRYRSSLG